MDDRDHSVPHRKRFKVLRLLVRAEINGKAPVTSRLVIRLQKTNDNKLIKPSPDAETPEGNEDERMGVVRTLKSPSHPIFSPTSTLQDSPKGATGLIPPILDCEESVKALKPPSLSTITSTNRRDGLPRRRRVKKNEVSRAERESVCLFWFHKDQANRDTTTRTKATADSDSQTLQTSTRADIATASTLWKLLYRGFFGNDGGNINRFISISNNLRKILDNGNTWEQALQQIVPLPAKVPVQQLTKRLETTPEDGLRIAYSYLPQAGCGVIATRRFETGDPIEAYSGTAVFDLDEAGDQTYTLELPNRFIDARELSDSTKVTRANTIVHNNQIRNITHDCKDQRHLLESERIVHVPNARILQSGMVVATRTILPFEEVYVSYGGARVPGAHPAYRKAVRQTLNKH